MSNDNQMARSQNSHLNSKVRLWQWFCVIAVRRFRPKPTAASVAQTLQTDDARVSYAAAAAKSVDARNLEHKSEEPQQLSPELARRCISRYNLGSSIL
jgi:hypothetical protein